MRRFLAQALTVAALIVPAVEAQRPTGLASSTHRAARTPWGDPDLQGTWPSGALITTPFERSPEMGMRAVLTAEEIAARDAAIVTTFEAPVAPQAFLHPAWNELGRGASRPPTSTAGPARTHAMATATRRASHCGSWKSFVC